MIPRFIAHMSSHLFSMTNYTGLQRTEQAYMYINLGFFKGKIVKTIIEITFYSHWRKLLLVKSRILACTVG